MNKKVGILIGLVLLGGIGWFAWTFLRWEVVFYMKAKDIMEKQVGRFPSVSTVTSIPQLMKDAARLSHIPNPDGVTTSLALEGRNMGPVTFWYLEAHVDDGTGKTIYVEQKIDNQDTFIDNAEVQEKTGVKIKK